MTRDLIVCLALICALAVVSTSVYSEEIDTADIFITPATAPDFFGGYIGGDGDLSNPAESIDWSIGNSRPFSAARTDDMVFSTCEGEAGEPGAWKERMRITKSGDVGIGTETPSARLHVRNKEVTSASLLEVTSGSRITEPRRVADPGGGVDPGTDPGSEVVPVETTRLVVKGDGSVGIGTDSPLVKLDIRDGAVSIVNAGEGNVLLYLGTERHWQVRQLGTGAGTALELASVGGGGNKNLVISTDGNVGIGTPSPEAKLHVNGDLQVTGVYRGDLHVTGVYRGDIGPHKGASYPKPAYDSGWVDMPQGEEKTFVHKLGGSPDNYKVDVMCYDKPFPGRPDSGEGIHHIWYGTSDGNYSESEEWRGCWWRALTPESIKVLRRVADPICEMARVRLWLVR